MYTVTIVDGYRSRLHECEYLEVTALTAEVVENVRRAGLDATPGIVVELQPSGIVLRLPDDGDAVYVANSQGKTVQCYRWNPPDETVDRVIPPEHAEVHRPVPRPRVEAETNPGGVASQKGGAS